MLIEINLAPGGGASKASRIPALSLPSMPSLGGDNRLVVGGILGVLIVSVLFFGFWRAGQRISTLERQVQQEVTDSTRYASTIQLVNSLRARQDTMEMKINVIRSVDTRRYVWPHLLEEISLSLPAFTWLTEVRTTAMADSLGVGPTFAVQGNAGSTQALTRLMKNMESSLFIGNVTLVTSEQDVLDGRTIQRFTLEGTYRAPPPAAIRTIPIVMVESS